MRTNTNLDTAASQTRCKQFSTAKNWEQTRNHKNIFENPIQILEMQISRDRQQPKA